MPPGSAKPFSKSAQRVQVSRHGVVSIVSLDHPLQPRSDERHWLMHHPAQLQLNGYEFRPHPLRRRVPPDHKTACRVRATKVREPEERECFWFPFTPASEITANALNNKGLLIALRVELVFSGTIGVDSITASGRLRNPYDCRFHSWSCQLYFHQYFGKKIQVKY